ncbi:MAG: NAD-glutamate dehydrogenase [Pseudomonadota bacterium]
MATRQADRTKRLETLKLGAPGLALAKQLFAETVFDDLESAPDAWLKKAVDEAHKLIHAHKSGKSLIKVHKPSKTVDATLVQIVTDDKPFLLDSVLGEIGTVTREIRLVSHPIIVVGRDSSGKVSSIDPDASPSHRLSCLTIILVPLDAQVVKSLGDELVHLMEIVGRIVRDWKPMLARVEEAVEAFKSSPPEKVAKEDVAEAIDFLNWLQDNHFTFLGIQELNFAKSGSGGKLKPSKVPPLGLLSDPTVPVLRREGTTAVSSPEIRDFLQRPDPLIVTKANSRSPVHRRIHMDYIGVKQYDENGGLKGELRIVGLFTSTAYTRSVERIPYLRRKASRVVDALKVDASSHSGKALLNVLETFPRDELFQIDHKTLAGSAELILQLDERPRVRVLTRPDKFDRFVSALVYVPRERYDTNNRMALGNYLADVYKGRISAWYPAFLENGLTRVHFIIGRDEGKTPTVSRAKLEAAVSELIRTWQDRLEEADVDGSASAYRFPLSYQEAYQPESAVRDAERMARLTSEADVEIKFHRSSITPENGSPGRVALKLFHPVSAIPLSSRVPVLENMGFRVIEESTFDVAQTGGQPVFVHDMELERADGGTIDLDALDERLTDTFRAVWFGEADNDGFNRLVMVAGLDWRETTALRVLGAYLRQLGNQFSRADMWNTLAGSPHITGKLIDLFHTRFDPKRKAKTQEADKIVSSIVADLENVENINDDRILRQFLELLQAALRCNFYTASGNQLPETLAFKFDPKQISSAPEPKPYRELFVFSPRVEGVHLRFGPVARGGLRWSDRAQDYRTEVLGLVKAQQVKNAVIVPVGSKGGFFPKNLPPRHQRDAFFNEGREAYKVFINAMLSMTDNLVSGKIKPPKNVVRHDGDDPYFVVAADKGTATFSDTANAISEGRDFWLGDAFASGGSAGYDHKVMGITARGGWEAVKRHFREMNRDIQTEPFTTVGVGDMSGDVFGNGMLLSTQTKLIAAFDHRDIFIDPDPDPAKSFRERKRLFELGRSSWADYNAKLISKGGGVFSRASKKINLSAAAASAIGLKAGNHAPNAVLTAILKADADLMWFGGIGTYVRASHESDLDADDRANDAIRITAKEVGAKVIGEGANLGFTQKARIEFNLHGGRCNSDAIDNSAGVNSSDVEVNIKIALADAVKNSGLTIKRRNTLLASMTDTVAELVLRNNYLQTLAISLCEQRGMEDFSYQTRLMQSLEGDGKLDRAVEDLPDDTALAEREAGKQPLSRAEIGVLLAYAKIILQEDLIASGIPDLEDVSDELVRYFPPKMQKPYAAEISGHRLKREIIATQIANSMINRGGPTYLVRAEDRTGAMPAEISRAFMIVREGFGMRDLNAEIDALDTKIDGDVQLRLYRAVQDLLLSQTVWHLRYGNPADSIGTAAANIIAARKALDKKIAGLAPQFMRDEMAAAAQALRADNVPKALAAQIASTPLTSLYPDIMRLSQQGNCSLEQAAQAFFEITGTFRIGVIEDAARGLSGGDYYDSLALDRALQMISESRIHMSVAALKSSKTPKTAVSSWLATHQEEVDHTRAQVDGIIDSDQLSVSRLTVAANLLGDLAKHV